MQRQTDTSTDGTEPQNTARLLRNALLALALSWSIALIPSQVARAAPVNLTLLLQKNAECMGWTNHENRLKSYFLEGGDATFDSQQLFVDVANQDMFAVSTKSEAGLERVLAIIGGLTPPKMWLQTFDGFKLPGDPEDLRLWLAYESLFDGDLPWATAIREASLDGRPALRIHPKSGADLIISLDEQGCLVNAVIDPDGANIHFHVDALSQIQDGHRFLLAWTFGTSSIRYRSVRPNPDHQVQLPHAYDGPAYGKTEGLPLLFNPLGQPIVTASIDGTPVRLAVDTGSTHLYLNSPLVSQMKPHPIGTLPARFNGAPEVETFFRVGDLKVGDISFKNVLAVEDTHPETYALGTDGALGLPLFATSEVVIDFKHQRLFVNRPGFHVNLRTPRIHINVLHGYPIADALMDVPNYSHLRALIDTGWHSQSGIRFGLLPSFRGGRTCNAPFMLKLENISIRSRVLCGPMSNIAFGGAPVNAIIGIADLNKDSMLIDYSRETLSLGENQPIENPTQ